jgi:F0F1-type ATP synthase membrane subunit b/b'
MMPQLDTSYFFSQFFWLCVSLAVLVFAFKKYFIPRMNKVFNSREEHIMVYSKSIERLWQSISETEATVKRLYEDGVQKSAEIVKSATIKYENALTEQLKLIKDENEARLNIMRSKIRQEVCSLESVFKRQVEIAAQMAFEQLFSRKL